MTFFDLETQNLSSDVGGWNNKHMMKMSVGITLNTRNNNFNIYTEENVSSLIEELQESELIVGFNIKNFDFCVLQSYTNVSLNNLPVFDILENIYKELGFRLSLENLTRTTLSIGKTSNGVQAVEWFKEGRMDKIIEYCKKDVEITKNLFDFGVQNGHLLYTDKDGTTRKVNFKFS